MHDKEVSNIKSNIQCPVPLIDIKSLYLLNYLQNILGTSMTKILFLSKD